jgi:hypothetical protein
MVTFSPNGRFAPTASEGGPRTDYAIDPEGSVTVVSVRGDFEHLDATTVRFAARRRFTTSTSSAAMTTMMTGRTTKTDRK